MKKPNEILYEKETDEVVKFKYKKIKIDSSYTYLNKNLLYKIMSFLSYYTIAVPTAFIFKLTNRIKFYNTHLLKPYKKSGCFIYANHTNQFGDGLCPGLICFPQKTNIIVNPSNVSIPIIGKFNKMWGALPLPDTLEASKNFNKAIKKIATSKPVLIYPEAHLWPYYTKIRNFPASSFRYPVKLNKPVFTFTTTYHKMKHGKKPKIKIFVDGPFFPNNNLNEKDRQTELRNIVFSKLCERSRLSNYEFVKYTKKEFLW